MDLRMTAQAVAKGQTVLGIELGSTRIKAVLMTTDYQIIATGVFDWENQLIEGVWTYDLTLAWQGIQQCYAQIAATVQNKYHQHLTKIQSMGISGMMHGYLAFDAHDQLLVPFRTWRNNLTAGAADQLSQAFHYNIPQRYSIAHLYQAILNEEPHVKKVAFMTTLSGYVHWQLTGKKVLGIGDASGMFPVEAETLDYRTDLLTQFQELPEVQTYPWRIQKILPRVCAAGAIAGHLTDQGARLLDPTGQLQSGTMLAPPEGDAGTGMVSTNSVRAHTGNISVGTSAFTMLVLDKPLHHVYRDVDLVATPAGLPTAMVHINNCSSDLNAWAALLSEFAAKLGVPLTQNELFEKLLLAATHGDSDAGGLVNYSYLSGENITRIPKGRPMFLRTPSSHFNFANFMLTQLYAAFAPLKIGMDHLIADEHLQLDGLVAQGGLFQTPVVAQQVLANALNVPITLLDQAASGGPWGMAVLAQYAHDSKDLTLADYLDQQVFANPKAFTLSPDPEGVKGYGRFLVKYQEGLPVEALAGAEIENYDG